MRIGPTLGQKLHRSLPIPLAFFLLMLGYSGSAGGLVAVGPVARR